MELQEKIERKCFSLSAIECVTWYLAAVRGVGMIFVMGDQHLKSF